MELDGLLTSGLKSTNSHPRQSNSMTVWRFGGELCAYRAGGALIVALASLYSPRTPIFSAQKPNRSLPIA
jgi:hypothetical protein